MNKFTAIISAFLFALLVTGCEPPYIVDEILLQEDKVSLVQRGVLIFEYEGNTCQLSYNADRHEFRAMDDDMAHYFILTCDADISDVGQQVIAKLKYTTDTDIIEQEGLTFRVEKMDQSSDMFWLWSNDAKFGVVVRKI